MKLDFITIGGSTEDISIQTREGVLIKNEKDILRQELLAFEYGAKIRVQGSMVTFGGGAANSAVNFATQGFKTACLTAVGNDNRGRRIIDNFKKKNVNIKLIQKLKTHESGFSFIILNPEKIVFSSRGANNGLRITDYELRMIKKAQWVYITSLGGKWIDVLDKVFSCDIKVAWNPGSEQLAKAKIIRKYIKKTSVLFLNKDEAVELVMRNAQHATHNKKLVNISELLRTIKSFGAEIVVITDGKKGAFAFDGEKFYSQDIIKEKKRVDATGVGDAYNSTFISSYYKHNDITKAMEAGVKNTASVIAHAGAQNGLIKVV